MPKYVILFIILCVTIALSAFYAEGYETYVMKTALINTNNGNGKMYTMDTDGNFDQAVNNVEVAAMGASIGVTTTAPPVVNRVTTTAAPAAPTVHGGDSISIFANQPGTQGLFMEAPSAQQAISSSSMSSNNIFQNSFSSGTQGLI